MDLGRRLRCLSQNSSLNFEAMSSSSSSSSQTMGGTTRSIPVSGSLPEDEMMRRMKLMEKTEVRVAESLPFEQAKP